MKMYRPHRLCPRNSKPKEPSLYRSLCVSILCMFLSTVMLVGTTMAWFSDSLQTGVYTISSANFTVTTYFCSDLAGENGSNNWQRLNPGNATMFGGGSLSSASYQTAYLKIVNASNIDLKYTLTITDEDAADGTGSTLPLSLTFKEVDNEAGLNSAFTSPGENTFTDASTPITVPAKSTKFVALKLSLTNEPPTSTDSEQIATQYKFGLRLAITQTDPNAQATEPPITSTSVDINITGGTLSTSDTTTSDAANGSDEVLQPPTNEDNSDGNHTETLTPDPPADPPAEVKPSAGPTESDTTSNVITSPSNGENLS